MGQDDARSASVILFYASSYTPSTSGQLLHLPEEPYDLAENGTVRDHDRFHRVVFGLQADLVSLVEEAFHGGFVFDKGDDDVAAFGGDWLRTTT